MFIGDQLYRLPSNVNNNNELVLCVVVEDNIAIGNRCKTSKWLQIEYCEKQSWILRRFLTWRITPARF